MGNTLISAIRLIALAVIASGTLPVTAVSLPPGKRLLVFVGSNTLGEHAVPELARAYLEQEKKATEAEPVSPAIPGNRKTRVVLRVSGSNTVGAVCAVNLAFNYFSIVTRDSKKPVPIEDHTTELDTPEGEKALAHDVMCDVDSDGIWETISIRPTGSSDAFLDLNLGACDVGMSSRPISGTEQRDLMPVCGNLASWLKMYPDIARSGLVAEGWADSVGSDEACRKVSLERARTAAEYIASSLGVKVTPTAKGKSFDPPNTSEENKQRNRRVVIKRDPAAVTSKP